MVEIKTLSGYCEFEENSTIQFFNDKDELIYSIDPTELSAIYGAWLQMRKEEEELEVKDY